MKKTTIVTVLLFLGSLLTAAAADARANWDQQCAKCHGATGKGNTKEGKKLKIRNLTTAKTQAEFTDEQAIEAMKTGLMNAAGKMTMKASEGLSDEEMKALVKFVRELKR